MILHRGNSYCLRIERGVDVIEYLTQFVVDNGITVAKVTAIGATNNAVVGAFDTDTRQYHSHHYLDKMEILSIVGNVTTSKGAPYIHLHAMLGMPDGSVVGGHLNSCVVSATCEMFVDSYNDCVERIFDEQVGLNLMVTNDE